MNRRMHLKLQTGNRLVADETTRELSGLAVPWNTTFNRYGAQLYFTAEGVRLPKRLDTIKLLVQHDDDRPIGYATTAENAPDGLRMTFAVPPTPLGDATLEQVDTLLRDGLSIGIELDDDFIDLLWDADPDDPIALSGQLREVSVVTVPQLNEARADTNAGRVLTLTSSTTKEALRMDPDNVDDPLSMEELAAQLRPLMHVSPPAHPLARYASLHEYMQAVRNDEAPTRIALALTDQISGANPGVVPPGWLTKIAGIIDQGRPLITGLGGAAPLPDAGMEIDFPYYDGSLLTLVDVQATQKTEVASAAVSIKKGVAPIATYAGASDVSYQLITRSTPSYLEAYERILALAYAARSEQAAEAACIAAAAAANPPEWVPGTGTADQLRAALFAASSTVQNVTGRPADFVGAATDVYNIIGGLPGLWPSSYGTSNAAGTADAGTLQANVSGLTITRLPYAAAGSLIVTNSEAFRWHESGPFPVSSEDVAKLGRNVGIWGLGAGVAALPTGIVKIDVVAGP